MSDHEHETRPCRRSFFALLTTALVGLFGLPAAARAATYHAGHNCPRCGRQVLAIWRFGPGRFHTHRCGTTTYWYH